MVHRRWTILVLASLLFLTACGDTGDGSNGDTKPAVPTNVMATAGEGSITVTWQDNSDDETGFVIYRDTAEAELRTEALTQIGEVGADVENYEDTAVIEGELYTYGVAAKGSRGTTEPAKQIGEPVSPEPGPGNNAPVVSDLLATPSEGEKPLTVVFSWAVTDPDSDPLTCQVDIDNDGTSEYSVDPCTGTSTVEHTYTIEGSYTAKLVASDGTDTDEETVAIKVNNTGGQPGTDTFPATSISGSIEGWSGGTAYFVTGGFYETDETKRVQFNDGTLSTTVDASGNFNLPLPVPPALTLADLGFCGINAKITLAGSSFITTKEGDTFVASDVLLQGGLFPEGAEIGVTNVAMAWIYSDTAFAFKGACGTLNLSVDFVAGWNTVESIVMEDLSLSLTSSAIPDNYEWQFVEY